MADALNKKYPKEQPDFSMKLRDGRWVHVRVSIRRTMLDGKMRTIICGTGGAYCESCDWTAQDYCKKNRMKYNVVSTIKITLSVLFYRTIFLPALYFTGPNYYRICPSAKISDFGNFSV